MKETGHRSDAGITTYREFSKFSRKEKVAHQSVLERRSNVFINEKEEIHLSTGEGSKWDAKPSKIHVSIIHGNKSLTIDILKRDH